MNNYNIVYRFHVTSCDYDESGRQNTLIKIPATVKDITRL